MDFEKAIRPLGRFTPMLEKVPQAVRDAVFDIRISVDKPVLLCCGDRILFLREDGDTAQYFSQNNVTATREDVEEIFLRLCGYSVYSHMAALRRRPQPRAAACWRAVLGQNDAAAGHCTIYRYGGASRGGA